MKTERRWLKSVISASEQNVVMPWTRGQRRRPATLIEENDQAALIGKPDQQVFRAQAARCTRFLVR